MDEEEKIDAKEAAKEEKKRADNNNANIVSNAADVAIATKNPYAVAAGVAVKVGDASTDGHLSKTLGKAVSTVNKNATQSRSANDTLQEGFNALAESKIADKIGTAASFAGGTGGAKAGEGAAKAVDAVDKAAKAQEAVEKAAKAQEAVSKTGEAADKANEAIEAAKKATENAKKAEEASKAAKAEGPQKPSAQNDTKLKQARPKKGYDFEASSSKYKQKIASNWDPSKGNDPFNNKNKRNPNDIIKDKVEEKKESFENPKPKIIQLDLLLDVVDVILDLLDSILDRMPKVEDFFKMFVKILKIVGIALILYIMIICVLASNGTVMDVFSNSNESTLETTSLNNNISYIYPNGATIEINKKDFIKGAIYFDLNTNLNDYYSKELDVITLYETYGFIYSLNLKNKYSDDALIINYDDIKYCNINGCYEVEENGIKYYIDLPTNSDVEADKQINILDDTQKEELSASVDSGMLISEFVKEGNKNIIEINEELKTKIETYVSEGLSTEEILEKLEIIL